MSHVTVNPDQVNQQKQLLEGAAQLAHQRDGIKLNYEGHKKGSRRQLITTIAVAAAIVAVAIISDISIIQ